MRQTSTSARWRKKGHSSSEAPPRYLLEHLFEVAPPEDLALAIDLQEDSDSVRAFFERYQIRSLVPLIDPNGQMFRRYGVVSLPTTFFVDPEGVIRQVEIGGPLSEERLRADVAKAMAP